MKVIKRSFRSPFVLFTTIALILSACAIPALPSYTPETGSISQTMATPNVQAITSSPTQSPPTATATTVPDVQLSLRGPISIGRGEIIDAEFLGEQKLLAIAWGSGVSVFDLTSKTERWYRETSANVIAFDARSSVSHLAVALENGMLQVYTNSDGSVKEFQGRAQPASHAEIAWSPNGRYLAFQYRDAPVNLLDLATGDIRSIPGSYLNSNWYYGPELVWSPDSLTITIASDLQTGYPKVISIVDGKKLFALQDYYFQGVQLSMAYITRPESDRVYLAVAGGNHAVELFSYPDGVPAGSFEGETDGADYNDQKLISDPDGHYLLSLGHHLVYDMRPCIPLTLWELSTGSAFPLSEEPEDLYFVGRVTGGFVGDQFLILYYSGQIMAWNLIFGSREAFSYAKLDYGEFGEYSFSANGERIITESMFGGATLWDTASGKPIQSYDESLRYPAVNFDGSQVSLFDDTIGVLKVVDVASGKTLWDFPAGVRPGDPPFVPDEGQKAFAYFEVLQLAAAFSPDGKQIAYNLGARVQVADLKSGEVTTLSVADASTLHDKRVIWMRWSPDGNALVVAYLLRNEGWMVLWEKDTNGDLIYRFQVPSSVEMAFGPLSRQAAFSPDGTKVAFYSSVWPSESDSVQKLVVYDREDYAVAQEIADLQPWAWVDDRTLEVLITEPEQSLARIELNSGKMIPGSGRVDSYMAASDPYGNYLALENEDESGFAIRDWLTGKVLIQVAHQKQSSPELYWSEDGRWIAVSSFDSPLTIWEVFTE